MEPKQMTKEEIFAYLNNAKVICTSEEETKKVQEKLFELGIEFLASGKRVITTFLLLIDGNNKIVFTDDIELWVGSKYKQIAPNKILAIQLKVEKPRFDPKSLQAFDKVLVRNENATVWHARFLDFYANDIYNTTNNEVWIDCVPYNEETKYLHGTANEAPEFYRI